MKKKDVAVFIEEMELIGDEWTPEQVEDVYGESTLEEALADRRSALGTFFDIIGKVINKKCFFGGKKYATVSFLQ